MLCIIPLEFVSIESDGFHLITPGKINNIDCNLLIDTGASRSVFDANIIHQYVENPELSDNEQLSTGLGTNEMKSQILNLEQFEIGTFKLRNFETVIIDMKHINQSFSIFGLRPIDGVIGGDILKTYHAVINYQKKELRLKIPKKMLMN
ncbi:MAG: clan AA aspartic protease [Bacteroidales bacterium]|nr:clan AA aspartic protease [Bacteroidales bacterium]